MKSKLLVWTQCKFQTYRMDPFWNPNWYDGTIMESILRIWIDYETQTGASSTEHPLEHITVTMCMSYAYLIVQTRKLKAQERKSQNPGSSFSACVPKWCYVKKSDFTIYQMKCSDLLWLLLFLQSRFVLNSFFWEAENHNLLIEILGYVDREGYQVNFKMRFHRYATNLERTTS